MKYYLNGTDEACRDLDTSAECGLSGAEAAARLERNGKNKLAAEKSTPLILRFLAQLCDPMTIILLVAAAISGVLAVFEGEGFVT